MSVQAQSQLNQAIQLFLSKSYSDALSLLKEIDYSQISGSDYGIYCIYRTEAGLQCGDYTFDEIDAAIEIFRFKDDTGLFARAKLLKGWRLIALGRHEESKEVLLEAYTNFLRRDDKPGCCLALNRLAQSQFQTGEIDLAISNLERCVVLSSELRDSCSGTNPLFPKINLAYLLFSAGRIQRSRTIYSELVSEFESQELRDRAVCLFMSAIPDAMCGRFNAASVALTDAETLVQDFKREQALIAENRGFVLMLQDQFAQAEKSLIHGLRISQSIAPDSALVSQIKRLLADCSIAKAKFKNAKLHATEALAVAEKIGQKVEIAACYRVFAQVAAHDGKADEARRQFKAAIELFNQISSRYELAVTRYLAASSGLFEKGESLAMLFLAKEYCEAEQVAPYIAKIDIALAKLEPRKPALSPINRTIDGPLIAANKKMLSLLDLARHVAPTNMTVLLTGETGTGKDLLARWIHDQSGRTGRFLSQNFAALPSGLEESELFGHRKGAFTGASDEKTGLFEAADHGTFFLNEIADSPMELQAKLLEVLETKSIRRIGETNDRPVDIRIIAATNHDLAKMVRENRFRADLFHRLNEINITLPPLAARADDIPLLVQQFIADSGVSVENGSARHIERLSAILAMREWPGNIRELRTFVRKLMMIADNDISKLVEIAQQEMPDGEEMQLARILEQSDWNQTRVADALGLSEGAVRKRIRKYGLDRV